MKAILRSGFLALALMLALAVPAKAGPWEDGFEAAERGDYATALRLWRLLGEQGDASAQYSLGIIYADGRGVPKDDAEAVKWWRLAGEQGVADAQTNLGVMYANGRGVPQDYEEAVKWYRLAAEQGDALAQRNLGNRYATGQGVPRDIILAFMWFNMAAKQGHEPGLQYRDRAASNMTVEQLLEAQRLSSECYASNYKNCDARAHTTATNNPGGPGTMIIRGVCSKLVAGGREYSSHCTGEVASVTNADGTISFIFSADGTMVAFSGNGREVKPAAGGMVILPVSFVAVRLADQTPEVVPASGQCRFTDPYRPEPALVECSASTARGPAEGFFQSDGMPPRTP